MRSANEMTDEPAGTDIELHRIADSRLALAEETGLTIPWDEVRAWLEARARGEHPPRPEASVCWNRRNRR